MADSNIQNTGKLTVTSGNLQIPINSNTVTWAVKDVDNFVSITKAPTSANIANIPILVTLTVKNPTSIALTNPIVTDQLDHKITYVAGTAQIDGVNVVPADVTFVSGLLTIKLGATLAAGATKVVTFQVVAV